MAIFKKVFFVLFLLSTAIFSWEGEAGNTTRSNHSVNNPAAQPAVQAQKARVLPKTVTPKPAVTPVQQKKKAAVEDPLLTLMQNSRYWFGIGSPPPSIKDYLKKHFVGVVFPKDTPWLVTTDGSVPTDILSRENRAKAAAEEARRRVRRENQDETDEIEKGVGLLRGMAEFCEFQKSARSSDVMGRNIPDKMQLFGACPKDPQNCNQGEGGQPYQEGRDQFSLGDKEECSENENKPPAMQETEIEKQQRERMEENDRQVAAQSGEEDPCARPGEEPENSAVAGSAATTVAGGRDQSHVSAGGGGGDDFTENQTEREDVYDGEGNVVAERWVSWDSDSKKYWDTYETVDGRTRVSTALDGSGTVVHHREARTDVGTIYIEAKSPAVEPDTPAVEPNTPAVEPPVEETTSGSRPGTRNCGAEGTDGNCGIQQGPPPKGITKRMVDDMKRMAMRPLDKSRGALDMHPKVSQPNPMGDGGGLPQGPSRQDRLGQVINPGSEGSGSGSLGMICDCHGKCGFAGGTGIFERKRDDCWASQGDENCGQGTAPGLPEGVNDPAAGVPKIPGPTPR